MTTKLYNQIYNAFLTKNTEKAVSIINSHHNKIDVNLLWNLMKRFDYNNDDLDFKNMVIVVSQYQNIKTPSTPDFELLKYIIKSLTIIIPETSEKKEPTIKNINIGILTDENWSFSLIIPEDDTVRDFLKKIEPILTENNIVLSSDDKIYQTNREGTQYLLRNVKKLGELHGLNVNIIFQLAPPEKEMKTLVSPPSVETLNDLTEFFQKDKSNYEKFRGSYTIQWGWLMWLQKKYGNDLVCVWEGTRGQGGIFYSWTKTKYYNRGMNVEPWFLPHLKKCIDTNSRLVVGILGLKVKMGYHANAFIFDLKNRVVSRFEPNGGQKTSMYNYKELNDQLTKYFNSKLVVDVIGNWKYKSPSDFCPVGPQAKAGLHYYEKKVGKVFGKRAIVEAGGFCAAWSLMFIHYKLLNLDASDQEIIKWLLTLSEEKLSNMVREYSAFIVNNIDRDWSAKEASQNLDVGDIVKYSQGKINYTGLLIIKKSKNAIIFLNEPKKKPRKGTFIYFLLIPMKMLRLAEDVNINKIKAGCQYQIKNFPHHRYTSTLSEVCSLLDK